VLEWRRDGVVRAVVGQVDLDRRIGRLEVADVDASRIDPVS